MSGHLHVCQMPASLSVYVFVRVSVCVFYQALGVLACPLSRCSSLSFVESQEELLEQF